LVIHSAVRGATGHNALGSYIIEAGATVLRDVRGGGPGRCDRPRSVVLDLESNFDGVHDRTPCVLQSDRPRHDTTLKNNVWVRESVTSIFVTFTAAHRGEVPLSD